MARTHDIFDWVFVLGYLAFWVTEPALEGQQVMV